MNTPAPGDRVWRWWDNGLSGTNQPLTVVRVNRKSITVDTDQGSRFRIDPAAIEGFVDWEEA